MAGIMLSIILDKTEKVYPCGETLKGRVKVVVEHECSAAALMVVLYCKGFSEQKGSIAIVEREKAETSLFKGSWTPGEYTYPFEFMIPPGPVTYKGQVFDVTWHLGAKARASEGEDVKAEVEINIIPAKRVSEPSITKSPGEVVYTESPRSLKGFFIFSMILLLVGIVVGWRNSPFAEGTEMGIFFFGGVIPMFLGLALLFFTTWQALVNKRIKKVEVRLGSRQASPGGQIPCSLTFYANLPFEVERVSVALRAEEIVDFRSSSSKGGIFRRHLLYENRQELPLAVKQVPVNVPVRAQGEVVVPEHIPCSINLMSDTGMALTWQLEFNIEMKRWPDWMHLENITVLP